MKINKQKKFRNFIIVIAILFSLFTRGTCNAGEERKFFTLSVNDTVNSNLLSSRSSFYPLADFELPADNEWKIDTIILRNKKKDFVFNVIKATSPYVKIVVYLEREEINRFGEELFGLLKKQKISDDRINKVILLPLISKQPYWMRDNGILLVNKKSNLITFVSCRSKNGNKVVLEEYFQSSLTDNIVENNSDIRLDFPGGEIVASESYIFCKNTKLFDDGKKKVCGTEEKRKIEMLCKKELIDLSAIKTPHSHIDLWLTPIDDKTILLGDVLLGKRIMKMIPKGERPKIIKRFTRAERLSGYKLKKSKRMKDRKRFFTSMLFKNNTNISDDVSMDAVKEFLENRGFTIVMIPSIGQLDISLYSYYSYNNVLMESYRDVHGENIKNVILPEYGHPLDEKARQVWESLGFRVRPFPMNDIARRGGAIRCSSQRIPGTVSYHEQPRFAINGRQSTCVGGIFSKQR